MIKFKKIRWLWMFELTTQIILSKNLNLYNTVFQ